MTRRADKWIRVRQLAQSVSFYVDQLEFVLIEKDESKRLALVKSPNGQPLLIAEEDVKIDDLSPWLEEFYDAPKAGQSLYFKGGDDLVAYKNRLLARIPHHLNWEETEWGRMTLVVSDPDQYVLSFEASAPISDEELLKLYEAAPERLKRALEGLKERDLDLFRAPEKWSIRQIVLHIVDSDATSLSIVKYALAEPGRTFYANPYHPDVWAEGLDYANRPIDVEVALFEAIRKHVAGLLKHLPDALNRTVLLKGGEEVVVRDRIHMLMAHALHHIEQIWETRKVYKK
jgi:hypothetical protein